MKPTAHASGVVEFFRGVAAGLVCWSHFHCNLGPAILTQEAGRCGVLIFFIISGYILPLSLSRSGYEWHHLPRFLVKRIARLYPAFLAVILLIYLLGAAKLIVGLPTEPLPSIAQLLANLTLSPVTFGQPYLLPVFWTLTVEWQYYVVVAVIYPLLTRYGAAVRVLTLATLMLGSLLPAPQYSLPPWIPAFVLGIVLWLRHQVLITPKTALAIGGLALTCHVVRHGAVSVVCPLAFAVLLFLPLRSHLARQTAIILGAISYPMYLFHVPLGNEISVRAWHWMGTSPLSECLQAILILIVTGTSAWLVYLAVDQHAIRLSSLLRFKPTTPTPLVP